MLKTGVPAPDFKGNSTLGTVHLKDYIGKKTIILIFFGNGEEELLFEVNGIYDEFSRLDAVVMGCCPVSVWDAKKFAQDNNIVFPVIADEELEVAKNYVVDYMNENANPVIYIIDLDGVICYAYEKNPSVKDLLRAVENSL